MKRTITVTTVVVLLHAVAALSLPAPQRSEGTATLRRVQVNARTITALPRTKKYVVDLTKRGVKYEFDPKGGTIDFSRVTIHTAKGTLPIASFLEQNFSKDQMSGFKLNTHSFMIGTATTEPLPPANEGTAARLSFSCGSISCDCVGDQDCGDLIFRSQRCRSMIFCWIEDDGKTHCHCRQHE